MKTLLHETEIDCLIDTLQTAPEGVVVCAGVWKGGDLLAMINKFPERYFIAIDSFRGLSEIKDVDETGEGSNITKGQFDIGGRKTFENTFKEAGSRLPNEIHEIWINPDSLSKIDKQRIAMLWLDLDLYQPTKDCLEYFGPMMEPEGIILTHDYGFELTPGVKSACDEYSKDWVWVEGGIFRQGEIK